MKVHIGKYPGPKSKRERIERVRIDDWDVWSLDHTLARIIHPALVKFKEDVNGWPSVLMKDDESLGAQLTKEREDELFAEWKAIIDEMIWAFSEIANDYPGEQEFFTKVGEMVWGEPEKDGTCELLSTGMEINKEGFQAYNKRIADALVLFGKHYQSLWT